MPISPTAGARSCTEIAAKRLAAIREYVEFGSGFKIAMRDLEIRGAGNLLGPEQSGYLMTVGYDHVSEAAGRGGPGGAGPG